MKPYNKHALKEMEVLVDGRPRYETGLLFLLLLHHVMFVKRSQSFSVYEESEVDAVTLTETEKQLELV